MYEFSGDKEVLVKAEDFGKRLLPAFNSATGIPYYWVNHRTGQAKGEVVNMAEGGSCLIEMGMLSWFTGNPVYCEKAKNASLAIFSRRSPMETFFLAETMKYLYLVFANPEGINPEECVFSTEAHPFRK